jgi:hypothetical protein
MPSYPPVAKYVSAAGIDKGAGWNQPPPAGHVPDAGIDHTAGLTKAGLDAAANPLISGANVTPIGTTTATVVWTTASLPGGSVAHRPQGSTGAYTTVSEAAGPFTAHSVPLTGLTTATNYEYIITQPGAAGSGGSSTYYGSFRTT